MMSFRVVLLQLVVVAFVSNVVHGFPRIFKEISTSRVESERTRKNGRKIQTGECVDCVFPFRYHDEWYFGCTTKNAHFHQPWCGTQTETGDFGWSNWGYCDLRRFRNNRPEMRTYSGKKCQFPFNYANNKFYGCTTLDHPRHKSWCMVNNSEGRIEKDLCVDEHNRQVNTFGGNGHGKTCQFPSVFNGKTYDGCTSKHSGTFWCSTTSDYDTDGKWGYCNAVDTDENLRIQGEFKTSPKSWSWTGHLNYHDPYWISECFFPFQYDGELHYGCTGKKPWCSTTYNFEEDRKWKYCDRLNVIGIVNTASGVPCTFPFVRNGKLTTAYLHSGRWSFCPLVYNYEEDKRLVLAGKKNAGPSPHREEILA